jgi:thiamine biosynthesis lipoprotein
MGTEILLLVPRGTASSVDGAVRDLFAVREAALSRFRADSDLCRASASAGRPVRVGALLLDALSAALRAARATGGAFDPCLGTQMAAIGYDRPFRPGLRVSPAAPALSRGGRWREVVVDRERRTVRIPRGVALDLGGIAKGMAVDAAIEILRDAGVGSALVSAGGDLAVLGRPPGAVGWSVRLAECPGDERVTLHGGALATSSVTRRTWVQGGSQRHHLVDPRTGEPARSGLRAVSVAAATCEQAEVAATAAMVLGIDAGSAFLRRVGLAATLVPELGAPRPLNAWPARSAA